MTPLGLQEASGVALGGGWDLLGVRVVVRWPRLHAAAVFPLLSWWSGGLS